ncbi:MAG: histone deacetylase [Armatimonadetes bacterium]|nr:histone deacetylase [Armatimonadota bacterium]
MSLGLYYDPTFLEHETGRHPEHRGRLETVTALLRERGLWDRLEPRTAAAAPWEALAAVHEPTYLELLREYAGRGGGFLTADTPFGARSWDAATRVSGAAMAAADAVLSGELSSAFVLSRPPGHHACPGQGMGFCLLNHVAVAARHAIRNRGLERVLVVDFDVHHGNGTQEIFYRDPAVLYFSSHQYPAYPGTGAVDEVGEDAGMGTTVNVPLPPGTMDDGFVAALERVLVPVARRFRPELILVSAGYDAHWTNTAYLNSIRMCATVAGFARQVEILRDLAVELCGGRVAFLLEGGYDPEALAWSVDATLRVLQGEPSEDPLGPGRGGVRHDLAPLFRMCERLHGLANGR